MIEVPLHGATRGTFALIDDADRPIIQLHYWRLLRDGYAATRIRRDGKARLVLMHRLIVDAPAIVEVDHINGDRLDNRRGNLRTCTRLQNAKNRKKNTASLSRFKGVSRNTRTHKWQAAINVDGRYMWLGTFEREMDAALAYDRAAVEHHREFAGLNFPSLRSAS